MVGEKIVNSNFGGVACPRKGLVPLPLFTKTQITVDWSCVMA